MVQRLFDEEIQRERYNKSVEKKSYEKGRLETLKENAKKLRQKGWTVEEIAEFIEMPVVDVEIWLDEN